MESPFISSVKVKTFSENISLLVRESYFDNNKDLYHSYKKQNGHYYTFDNQKF